jgi:hypothetical protein
MISGWNSHTASEVSSKLDSPAIMSLRYTADEYPTLKRLWSEPKDHWTPPGQKDHQWICIFRNLLCYTEKKLSLSSKTGKIELDSDQWNGEMQNGPGCTQFLFPLQWIQVNILLVSCLFNITDFSPCGLQHYRRRQHIPAKFRYSPTGNMVSYSRISHSEALSL